MNQRTLFDVGPAEPQHKRSRDVDPDTSHMAAAQATSKVAPSQSAMLDTLKLSGYPMTAEEMAAESQSRCGGISATYRKRVHELVRDGRIVSCGVRVCRITGSNATIYRRV